MAVGVSVTMTKNKRFWKSFVWRRICIFADEKDYDMSEKTLDTIGFVTMIVNLFAKKHKFSEPVAYHYLSRFGGTKLLVNHYGYLHTQDYDQVVDDLSDYCRRQGGTLQ